NTHLRRLLVESAWSYRYTPALKGELKKRQQGKSPEIQAISWKAQHRLHRKYTKMLDWKPLSTAGHDSITTFLKVR
ncbi:hypothetical protein N0M98_26560, partial [Paenibacillus doosanensis]|nr:hypothetical protein [Paenibacillus doosanensis]